MAKERKRGNREAKKPKAIKAAGRSESDLDADGQPHADQAAEEGQ